MIDVKLFKRSSFAAISLAVVFSAAAAMAAPKDPAMDRETVVIGLGKEIDNFDPQVAATGDSQRYGWAMFDTLYRFNHKGIIEPALATSFEISSDRLSYTFKLRPGLKFHNGEALESDDVKFSMERILDPATKSTRRPFFANLVQEIITPDPQTVTIKISRPDGAFINKVAGYFYILPKDYTQSLGGTAFGTTPVGSGPYKIVERQTAKKYVLERNDAYWGEKPKIKRLVWLLLPEPSSRANALITGEIDLADLISNDDVPRLKKVSHIEIDRVAQASPLHIRLYANRPELPQSKPEVRQALNYAIDTSAIIDTVLNGIGKPMATFISSYYPYGVNTEIKSYPYDPKKAKELLAKAGYPKGFKTSLYLYTGSLEQQRLAEAVAAYWSEVGIETELKALNYSAWSSLNNTHQTHPMTVMQFSNAMYDPIHPISGGFKKGGTWSDYENPRIEELLAKVEPIDDRAQRDAIFKEVGKILHEDAAAVYISELYYLFARKTDLHWRLQEGSGYYNFSDISWK
jgi:peptide/nickel transport system substrate-binding protein